MDKSLEREKEILKQVFDSFEDVVKECVDFYYLTPVPKTAQEIREQCLFIGREEEIANTKDIYKKRKFGELPPPHIKRYSFDVVEEKDGQIRLVNPQFDGMNIFTVEALARGLANAVNEYNEEIKKRNHDEQT